MGYYSNVNPDLLRFIPPDAKTVLEIGCGEGALAGAYRRVNPAVRWFGVEIEREPGDVAWKSGRVDNVLEVDVEDHLALNERLDEPSDVLVLGDVLEHLKDPWAVLKRLALEVNPGGQILACIPNVQHWTVIRDLLDGKWDYADSGLMDKTHLRFFTLKSIREMFDAAGLQVFEIVGRDICNQGFQAWYDDFFGMTGPDAKEMLAYQYIVRAIKPERWSDRYKGMEVAVTNPPYAAISPIDSKINRIDKLHIHAVTAEACCARPRILEPFAMLGTIPWVKCTMGEWPGKPDVLILQRRELNMIRNPVYRTSESVIIAEVDDLPEALGMDSGDLRACHAIQCSTEALAEVCRQYNPNVMVFPNQIAELPAFKEKKNDHVVIFYGAQNRQADWKAIMPALNRVLADPPVMTWVHVVHDEEFYHALEVPASHKFFTPFCEYTKYCEILRSCDIALLPLEDTPFNRCKSDIKFLECAAEGVAVLASKGVPVEDGEDGWLYVAPGDFRICLQHLIADAEDRQRVAKKAYAYVRDNRLLGQHFRQRHAWYQSLLAAKSTLDAQLADRVPELSGRPVTA